MSRCERGVEMTEQFLSVKADWIATASPAELRVQVGLLRESRAALAKENAELKRSALHIEEIRPVTFCKERWHDPGENECGAGRALPSKDRFVLDDGGDFRVSLADMPEIIGLTPEQQAAVSMFLHVTEKFPDKNSFYTYTARDLEIQFMSQGPAAARKGRRSQVAAGIQPARGVLLKGDGR
jgi:hypothetical protein